MLKTQKVDKYTVSEAGIFQNLRLAQYRDEADKIHESLPECDSATQYALFIWPMVAATTEPAPTWAEFTEEMRDDVSMPIVSAVMELNAHWFGEVDKKK